MIDEIPFIEWITFEDSLRVERILFPRKFITIHLVATFMGIAAILLIIIKIAESLLFKILFTLTIGGFIGGIMWFTNRLIYKDKRKSYTKDQTERRGIVSVERIEVVTDTTKSEIQWDFFTRIEESKDLVFAAKDKEYYIAFAPYMFGKLEEWERCKKLLKEKKKTIQPDE